MDCKSAAALGTGIFLIFIGCERPESPHFNLNNKIEAPITTEKVYRFLGRSNALIDTASEDFDSLFSAGGNGLVSLSIQKDFSFKNFDDAIPEVSVDPTNVNVGMEDLIDPEVEDDVSSKKFTIKGVLIVDNTDFRLTEPEHYIELDSGRLRIDNIINNIDLDFDTLRISFPGIRRPPYTVADSLVVRFEGDSKIAVKSSNAVNKNISLSGLRLYAEGNTIDYNIMGVTENASAGNESVLEVIRGEDSFTVSIALEDLEVRKAFGVLEPRKVLINDDMASNGVNRIGLFNDDEAEIIDIDEYEDFSEQVHRLQFADPLLRITYNTNLGIETTIYAVIAGIDANGQIEYLSGKQGGEHYVSSFEVPDELTVNGRTPSSDELIKFKLHESPDGTTIRGINLFDKKKSNVDAFVSNIPVKIRLIGIARLNESPEDSAGIIVNPVQFEPDMSMDLPLYFSSAASTFTDTVDADLKSLPGEGDEHVLSDATVTIEYINNLPLRLNLSLIMLDSRYERVIEIPLPNQEANIIHAAAVHPVTRFVESGRKGKMILSLNKKQLGVLNRTRYMVIKMVFDTTNREEVRIRADDSISFSIQMSVVVESDFD